MDKFIVVPTAYIPDNPAVSAAQGHYNLAHCIQIIPNKFIYPVRHFWNQVGRNGFWIGFNHNQIIVDILATVKKTFDKLKPLCELSCVIDFVQINSVLPSVEGKPSKPAECFSHTDGVSFTSPDSADTLTRPFVAPVPARWIVTAHMLNRSKHPAEELTKESSRAPDCR